MEIIIVVAVLVGVALFWVNYVKAEKSKNDDSIDTWEPPKELVSKEKEWPFGTKLPEGKIHVKVSDVSGSENRVETPAPAATTSVPLVAAKTPAKKAPVKKPAAKPVAAKPAAAKRAPAKKKSV
jgi:hypothetical protein